MLKSIELRNWKSYRKSILFIDPLTILIGTNSSGKSNLLDALQLLNRLASGVNIKSALGGDLNIASIRGGLEWAALKPGKCFTLSVVSLDPDDAKTEYQYSIEISLSDAQAVVKSESLKRLKFRKNSRKNPYEIWLFNTADVSEDDPYITAKLYNEKKGSPRHSSRTLSILAQLRNQKVRREIQQGVEQVTTDLTNLFILDPIPSHMRDYTQLSEILEPDASNVAGVIAGLDQSDKEVLEETITRYVKHLPEKDVERVYSEKVGKFNSDAMLYCDESWSSGQKNTIDARGMSDGTLRFIAIITALMTRPENSLLIIEEVDNGLHPSRACLLVKMLREISAERGIDIVITTHNPALLNQFGPDMIPFVSIAHRDSDDGYSCITLFEDLKNLPKLLSHGKLGTLASEGYIEENLGEQ